MSLRGWALSVLVFASACQSWGIAGHAPYPDEWWKPVPRDQAASWEVLPQDAGPGEVILSKRTELGILSNFAATPFVLDGERFASVEGFWQMMKYPENAQDERAVRAPKPWPYTRAQVAQMTGFEAKHAGNIANEMMRAMKINWVTYQGKTIQTHDQPKGDFYQIIRSAEQAKLAQNPQVREILRKTGDLKLVPDHHQYPDEWPAWRYNEIWMEIRAGL